MKKAQSIFFWHGSPINAIEQNIYSNYWKQLWETIYKPQTILCISAHWETIGTYITSNEKQKIIYDFYWFPKELYEIKYEVKWNNYLAFDISKKLDILTSTNWWLDHWTWSILKHMYPLWDIEILQMSIDRKKSLKEHYELWLKLKYLKQQWVLIIWSWNIVHNLSAIDWYNKNNSWYDWALKTNETIKNWIIKNDIEKILNYEKFLENYQLSIPTKEHFIPLIYILALKDEQEKISFFNEKIDYWSISMTSFINYKN